MARSNALWIGAALAVAALIASSASASPSVIGRQLLQDETFPPNCSCIRDSSTSPYRLSLAQPSGEDGFIKYCFTVVNIGGCDPKLTCCNGQQGVEKVEFEVEDDCKGSLKRVTVDGNQKSFEYNTKLNVLRITNLGKTAETANGTQICLFLKAGSACTTLSQLCAAPGPLCKYSIFNAERTCCPVSTVGGAPPPPPPFTPAVRLSPPPPPSSFPHCKCYADPAGSKLTATLSGVVPSGNLTKACFTVDAKADCLLGSPCCEFSLFKFEMDANPECVTSLVYSTLDGAKRPRFFQLNPYPVIKVTNINKPYSQVAGTQVCLFLKPPCNTLEKLCPGGTGKCTVALFNPRSSSPSCCPLSIV